MVDGLDSTCSAKQGMRFELRSVEDRKRAFRKIREAIIEDLVSRKCLPYLQVFVVDRDGSAYNRYLGLYVVTKDSVFIDVFSVEFVLRLFLKLKRVTEVEYDPDECRVVVTYENR